MSASKTSEKRLARELQASLGIRYTDALSRVRLQREAAKMTRFDGEHMIRGKFFRTGTGGPSEAQLVGEISVTSPSDGWVTLQSDPVPFDVEVIGIESGLICGGPHQYANLRSTSSDRDRDHLVGPVDGRRLMGRRDHVRPSPRLLVRKGERVLVDVRSMSTDRPVKATCSQMLEEPVEPEDRLVWADRHTHAFAQFVGLAWLSTGEARALTDRPGQARGFHLATDPSEALEARIARAQREEDSPLQGRRLEKLRESLLARGVPPNLPIQHLGTFTVEAGRSEVGSVQSVTVPFPFVQNSLFCAPYGLLLRVGASPNGVVPLVRDLRVCRGDRPRTANLLRPLRSQDWVLAWDHQTIGAHGIADGPAVDGEVLLLGPGDQVRLDLAAHGPESDQPLTVQVDASLVVDLRVSQTQIGRWMDLIDPDPRFQQP